jgi:hypothetical protein
MADPTGERDRSALRLDFDRRLLLQFRGSTITSDAGLLAYRELDNTLSLTDTAADALADERTGKNGRHRLAGMLRQSVFGPWPLRDLAAGGGRGIATDVRRYPVSDRPATGIAHASMRGAAIKRGKREGERYASMRADQCVSPFRRPQPPGLIVSCWHRARFAVAQTGHRGDPGLETGREPQLPSGPQNVWHLWWSPP